MSEETTIEKGKKAATTAYNKAVDTAQLIPAPVWWITGIAATYWWGIKPILKDLKDNSTPEGKEFDEDVNNLLGKPAGDGTTEFTITATEAQSIADAQFESMRYQINDENDLVPMLENLNGKDLQLVFVKFGVRKYNTALGSDGGSVGDYLGLVKPYNLFGWYKAEVTKSKAKTAMRNIWQKSGYAHPFL